MAFDISILGYTLSIIDEQIIDITASILIIIFFLIFRYMINNTFRKKAEAKKMDPNHYKPMIQIINLFLTLATLTLIIWIWGAQGSFLSILAGAGFAGIVIGMAAQDFIGNFLAGVTLFFDRPFKIGDSVEIAGVSGVVRNITTRSTKIKSFDGEKVVLPNSSVVGSKIINYSAYKERRRSISLKVIINKDISKTIEKIERLVKEFEEAKSPSVFIKSTTLSYAEIAIQYWFSKNTDVQALDTQILSRIYNVIGRP